MKLRLLKSLFLFAILVFSFPLIMTEKANAQYRSCIAEKERKWQDKPRIPIPFVPGDTVINNPRYKENGQAPVLIFKPNFEKQCAQKVANLYFLSKAKGWNWALKSKGQRRKTIDTTIEVGADIAFTLELYAYDANSFKKPAIVDLYYTNALGENKDIKLGISRFNDEIDPNFYQRTKVGKFRTDTIFFWKGEGTCPRGRVCPE